VSHISSYSKVFLVGHRWVRDIFDEPVIIQEKIDGSQVSFGLIDGVLTIRSKNADIYIEDVPKMFRKGVDYILSIKDDLVPGYIYRGEYLQKPKHNTLAYERVPKNHIIIYDVAREGQNYLMPEQVKAEAEAIGLEVVPTLYEGMVDGIKQLKSFLDTDSILGGCKIEGVVIKNYNKFTDDKKTMMAKYVSTEFQEKHQDSWRKANPTRTDILDDIIETYRTEARWRKAVQHLRERGELEETPRDIGALIREVKDDVKDECEEEIKDRLFDYFWKKDIERSLTHGLPEWYKEQLANKTFEEK
jgi:hypothetical protein